MENDFVAKKFRSIGSGMTLRIVMRWRRLVRILSI